MDGGGVDFFRYDGYRLAYETYGDGPQVTLFLHGLLLDSNLNRGIAQALSAKGHRVVLLELLGHGRSDRPRHATLHRMDSYARQTVALLDHLGVEQAVVGGVSLGANVSLHVAVEDRERVRGLLVEMPVLEWAAPACGAVFIPLLLAEHFGRPVTELIALAARRIPRSGFGPADSFLNAASMAPQEIAAILHGLLVGPTAPPVGERERIAAPTLVIGHGRDYIHPFSDAENLVSQLPNARMVRARSPFELRTRPTRLTREITAFLDEVWQPQVAAATGA